MARGIGILNLTGPRALEAESDYNQIIALREEDEDGTDIGVFPLVDFDPAGTVAGGGFKAELRSVEGGTLLATAVVSMGGARALGTLTVSGTPTDADEILIGSVTYQFKDTPAAAYDVQIGADAETSIDNLVAAINAAGDGDGPEAYAGTLEHPDVIATKATASTMRCEAKTGGTQGNAIATTDPTDDGSVLAWAATALAGGTGQAGFLVHFDGEDLPSTLVTQGRSRSCVIDTFGILSDGAAVKIHAGRVNLHSSATDPNV